MPSRNQIKIVINEDSPTVRRGQVNGPRQFVRRQGDSESLLRTHRLGADMRPRQQEILVGLKEVFVAGPVFFIPPQFLFDPVNAKFPPGTPTLANPFSGFILTGAGAAGINIIDNTMQTPWSSR
jgi:hypothetical protein